MNFDLAIIGGGPGGYTAAEKAAQEGLSVVLFEKNQLGGTCLNRGCIPTKALLHASELYAALSQADQLGIHAAGLTVDHAALHRRKEEVVSTLRQGVERMLKTNRVSVVSGAAQITAPGQVCCNGEAYSVRDIIIATGSKVSYPPIPGIHSPGVYTSDDLLEGTGKQFQSLIIIGGGVIGCECAALYHNLGTQVSILEAADRILPLMDRELSQRLTMHLKKQGISVAPKSMVQSIQGQPGAMEVSYTDAKGAAHTLTAEGVLLAAGRSANLEGLLPSPESSSPSPSPLSLALERGAVLSNEHGETSVPHIYVIGDARARTVQLAHVASAQAENVVAHIAGKPAPLDLSTIPSCVYTTPEIASVGLTEEEAKAAGIKPRCAKALTGANGKCLIENSESGYVKLVSDSATNRLLGAQLICPRATDLIGELALAVQQKLTVSQLASAVHAHPTFSEMNYAAAQQLR